MLSIFAHQVLSLARAIPYTSTLEAFTEYRAQREPHFQSRMLLTCLLDSQFATAIPLPVYLTMKPALVMSAAQAMKSVHGNQDQLSCFCQRKQLLLEVLGLF